MIEIEFFFKERNIKVKLTNKCLHEKCKHKKRIFECASFEFYVKFLKNSIYQLKILRIFSTNLAKLLSNIQKTKSDIIFIAKLFIRVNCLLLNTMKFT